MTPEAQIQADVEALRQQVTDTQDLYREVSALLFFRYGITPTANKLYQYVRKGSMSAPAEALVKFWNDLREKSRVRIEHPDLPEELKAAAGHLVATLWNQAQSVAQDGLSALRAEAHAAVDQIRVAQDAAEHERHAAIKALDESREAHAKTNERVLVLERELAAERSTKESLAGQLAGTQQQRASLEAALAEARRDFAVELEKVRDALKRSEERFDAAEKRALLEIDRERTSAAKAHKELGQLRESQSLTTRNHRDELAQVQSQLSEARQKLAAMEGALQELRPLSERLRYELQSIRASSAEAETQNALLRSDLSAARSRVTTLEEELMHAAAAKTTSPRRRKKALDAS